MSDLRKVYAAVWGSEPHAANFRRKVLATEGFVIPVGRNAPVGRGSGAPLFRRGPGAILDPPIMRPPS
jgi:8-oxo-dGTP diphosphatase